MSPVPADGGLADVCARHGLIVLERLELPGGASHFVARVRDSAGGVRLLKRGNGLRGQGEIPALKAFSDSGHVPGAVHQLDDATFLCEWVDGVPLDRSPGEVGNLLRRCGKALREMHAVAVPAFPFMPIRQRAGPEWFERDMGSLPEAWHGSARAASEALCSYRDGDAVLLHGDCVPQNVLISGERVVFVDPIGFLGPRAWDLAQLAIAVPGRDRRANLEDIVAGYGTRPALVEAALAYLAFLFLSAALVSEHKAPGTSGPVLRELGQLCETLIAE